ncbi:hydrogenase nickel incorporation protein HypB [Paenarthrobacter sp. Z7-10]|uniref:hydrogenase nickel incorporation protein HypB n=1 Tax=Paenarthrobacter sp. Z7-10 TaxID=2787635 RepID=UPI0022A9248C|nr:hydrogenase nickel incorporation protein HypB [Paenarthrobacter sp. Z7-10]MCZ2403490.1 hydrogenase nickel incorporation protein HypB [Paenarthrobacter sp. Z7-10]
MCSTCGCSDDAGVRISSFDVAGEPGHSHPHDDGHSHPHDDGHSHPHDGATSQAAGAAQTLLLEANLLAKNDLLAARNRGWLEGRGIRAFNVMSSPGAGKTTLLVRTIRELGGELNIAVVEGDQETSLDAERIRTTGSPVVQINTGAGCHLDADMLHRGLDALNPEPNSTVFIENVGNLVCPALFDLGEAAKVVVISVTEGDGKPQKYPHMFLAADLVIINKSDLLPYVDFDVDKCILQARQLNPHVDTLVVSATTGQGLEGWYDWLRKNQDALETRPAAATLPLGAPA